MIDEMNSKLLVIFSALSDANRLRIVGLLAQRDLSVEELAEILGLRASTVSHHLSKLNRVGLVTAQAQSYYNVYHLNKSMLEAFAKSILSEETLPNLAAGMDLNAYDQKVLKNYLNADGRLKTIPSQRKKLEAVLRHIIQAFEPNEHYTEQDVNEILGHFHKDTASLRRELIGYRLLARRQDGQAYWRPKE